MDDQRVAGAAEVAGDLLGPLERSVHRPGPADRDMRLARRPADLVQPLDRAFQAELHAEQAGKFAERPLQPSFGAGAVVADDVEDQRVVEFAGSGQAVDIAADLGIGVLHESGVVLHQPGVDLLRSSAERLSQDGMLSGRGVSFVPFGITPSASCLRVRQLPFAVPAVVELAGVLLAPYLRVHDAARGRRTVLKYANHGLSGLAARTFRVQAIASSVMSAVKW